MSNSVFITDENQAKSVLIQGAMIQDYGMVHASQNWAQSSLTPENYVATINDAIDNMTPEARQWYERQFGNGLRLVVETDMQGRPLDFIPPYVVRGRAG